MHTQKLVIYTCAFITSASALVISHDVKQDSEEFIRQSANVVEAPWRLVAVPPVTVPPIPQKAVADNSLTQLEAVKKPADDFSADAFSPDLAQAVQAKSIYSWIDDNGTVHYTDMQKGEKVSK